jgi:hypothetical protein
LNDQQNQQLASVSFIVTVNATFNRFRSGHPQMSTYRKWVEDIVTGIKADLDERVIWKRVQDEFVFRHDLP